MSDGSKKFRNQQPIRWEMIRPKDFRRDSLAQVVSNQHWKWGKRKSSSQKERDVLNLALSKYRPGRSELIIIGDGKLLKPALQLMNAFRLRIDAIEEDAIVTSYTRWLQSVQVIGTENQEVYVTFSPRFGRNRRNDFRSLLPKNRPILVYEVNIP
jgi:hypothetical protein